MQLQYTVYAGILILSSLISILLALISWKRREMNGALYLSLLFFFVAEWSLTNGFELASADMATKLIWSKLSYIGIVAVAPLWFLFSLDYTHNQEVIKKTRVIILFLLPIFSLYLTFTNEMHGLIWSATTPYYTSEGLMILYTHGPAGIATGIYSYILILAGLVLIGQNLFKTTHLYQRQAMLIFTAALIPLLTNSLYTANLTPFFFDPTPLSLTFSGILILWSIEGYKFLDIMPPAYRSLFSSMKNAVVVLDTRERIMDVNPAAETLLGIHQSCIGRSASQEIYKWEELAPGRRSEGSVDIKMDRSETMWMEVQFTPVYQGGLFSGWIYIFEDITNRKRIENRILKSEKKYRELADLLPQTVFETDVHAEITFMNLYGHEMFGYTPEDISKGLNILNLIVKEDRALSRKKIGDVLAGLDTGDEYTAQRRDNSTFPIIIHSNPIIHNGVHEGFRGIIVDISEIKEAENRILSSLKEKEVLLKEIHHRVKNNMQIISSLLSLQANHTGSEEATEILKESRGRVKSMAMIHEKLYHSDDLGKVNIEDYLKNLVMDILKSYSDVSSEITADFDIEHLYLNIDTAIPMGLLVNELVSNSCKHAFPEGKGNISVELKSTGENYILTVSDNGTGLPHDIDPFEASSLGLQLVVSLSIQLEGDLEVIRDGVTSYILTFSELEDDE